jgi:hypothetical protein
MFYDWEHTLFGSDSIAAAFVSESTMIHYTCIEQGLKHFFGLNFGGYSDIYRYYSHPPPLLATVNISGLADSVHAQVLLAAQLAASTRRTLIWPDAVDMVQRRGAEEEGRNETYTYLHRPNYPGIRAVSWASAEKAGLKVVESRYLANQALNSPLDTLRHRFTEVVFDVSRLIAAEHTVSALEHGIAGLTPDQVAVLDFANFSPRLLVDETEAPGSTRAKGASEDEQRLVSNKNLTHIERLWFRDVFDRSGAKQYIAPLADRVNACPRVNDDDSCLQSCE